MNLVIVESPAKAKTINKYLGKDYTVLASYGHIRDLPSKNGSVDPENNFKMIWEIDNFSKKYLDEITDVAKDSSKIILATDPDREGEAIAWHVKEFLNEKKLLKDKIIERVVFNEITKNAVTNGIGNPRQIEPHLVDSYMARRALDYLVGFNISPILWTKLPGSKSAGRVQSVALRLLTEREHEIENFKPEEFWSLNIKIKTINDKILNANVFQIDGKKIEKFSFRNKNDVNNSLVKIKTKKHSIIDISSKVLTKNPSGPFTTSTLQQSSFGKLGFGASRTMQIAQKLYQGIDIEGDAIGLITYMRTDGTNISNEAVELFRSYIKEKFGNDYLPDHSLNYSGKKAKNAQEAHEAIRPTDIKRSPENIKKYLSTDQYKLYNLIWSKALSSQMKPTKFNRSTITIASDDNLNIFKASGSVIKFDGFLKLYNNDKKDENENTLPQVLKGPVRIEEFIDEQHFTQPPPKYSEASLVKKLEELGIGRPSTYASIISAITNRGYAEIINKRFFPTDRGKLISAFLEKLFSKYVDYEFTAKLEDQLDNITSGKEDWIKVLDEFWKDFNKNVSLVKEKRTREVLDLLNESLGDLVFEVDENDQIDRKCKLCNNGQLSLKNSFRGGAFIGCSNYPNCKFTRPLSKSKAAQQINLAEPKMLGKNNEGKPIFLKNGRFGPYLQFEIASNTNQKKEKKIKRKSNKDEKDNIKNISIPKGISLKTIDLDKAKYLCSLPINIGIYPENGKEITLNSGRFGPYLKCENKSARLENVEEIFSIGLDKAIILLAEAKVGRISSLLIKVLGEHPDDKKLVKILKGQYGPYIKYKSLNVTIPEEKDPEELTMEEALILIEKRKKYYKSKKTNKGVQK